VTDDAATENGPAYGTCAGCQQLKHVTTEGLVRDHNRFEATGTVVFRSRCSGSGARYQEAS
jgi:membrane-bound inhibitor of C-type lysozyme